MSNFVSDCISGNALIDEIDDYIDRWHDSDEKRTLIEFLGMTEEEYSLFMKSSEFLPFIIKAHKEKTSVVTVLSQSYGMAARSENIAKSEKIISWLKQEGLWDQ